MTHPGEPHNDDIEARLKWLRAAVLGVNPRLRPTNGGRLPPLADPRSPGSQRREGNRHSGSGHPKGRNRRTRRRRRGLGIGRQTRSTLFHG